MNLQDASPGPLQEANSATISQLRHPDKYVKRALQDQASGLSDPVSCLLTVPTANRGQGVPLRLPPSSERLMED